MILEKGVPKTVRTGEPIFEVIIEIDKSSYTTWTVIDGAASAVDALMKGESFSIQRRSRTSASQYTEQLTMYT